MYRLDSGSGANRVQVSCFLAIGIVQFNGPVSRAFRTRSPKPEITPVCLGPFLLCATDELNPKRAGAIHKFGTAGPGHGDPIIVASLAAPDEPAPHGRSLGKLGVITAPAPSKFGKACNIPCSIAKP